MRRLRGRERLLRRLLRGERRGEVGVLEVPGAHAVASAGEARRRDSVTQTLLHREREKELRVEKINAHAIIECCKIFAESDWKEKNAGEPTLPASLYVGVACRRRFAKIGGKVEKTFRHFSRYVHSWRKRPPRELIRTYGTSSFLPSSLYRHRLLPPPSLKSRSQGSRSSSGVRSGV